MFRIEVSRAARRYLERLDNPTRQRISAAIDELGGNPFEGDVRRLQGVLDLTERERAISAFCFVSTALNA